jgi:hypothetical protein
VDFFARKIRRASTGFEPVILGARGQHANPNTTVAAWRWRGGGGWLAVTRRRTEVKCLCNVTWLVGQQFGEQEGSKAACPVNSTSWKSSWTQSISLP